MGRKLKAHPPSPKAMAGQGSSKLKGKEPATFASRVRAAAKKMQKFSKSDLFNYDYGCYVSRKTVDTTLRDFMRRGEIIHMGEADYRYVHIPETRSKLDVIWHLVRSYRQFSTDEMERLSGAARYTVLEYLNCLRKFGYIRIAGPGNWQIVTDPGPETPVNTYKCAKLKRLRAQGTMRKEG